MSNSLLAHATAENVPNALGSVARSLREAAESTQEIPANAREILSTAAADILRIAEKLRNQAVASAKDVTREIQGHPKASIATALAAVAGCVGILAIARRRRSTTL